MIARQYVIPTRPGMGRGLVNHDERSKAYRAVELTDETKPRTRHWRRAAAYDQGQTSRCVAFTGKGLLNSQPLSAPVPWSVRSRYDPDVFYAGSQKADQWDGEAYDGTSGLGFCRYAKSVGLIRQYRWVFGLNDLMLTVSHVGPVGLGIKWKADMFRPDSHGVLSVTGEVVGGHEIEASGIDLAAGGFVLTNSWSPSWGIKGRALLPFDGAETLLGDSGDGFVITG